MAGRVIWRRLAEQDLTEPYVYIGADSPAAAERLLNAVEESVRLLLENPGCGRPCEFRSTPARGIRSWGVRGFENYLIFYRPSGEDIEIIRFLHGARDTQRLFGDQSWPRLLLETSSAWSLPGQG